MEKDINAYVAQACRRARAASRALASVTPEAKNKALSRMAELISDSCGEIKKANAIDVEKARADGLSKAMIDRLVLDDKRIRAMAAGVREVIELADPGWAVIKEWKTDAGLDISRVRVPIGVIGIIYESRPNVTVEAGILCFKSGNAVILKGGKESFNSNICLGRIMQRALEDSGLPADCVQVIETTDRAAVSELLKQDGYVDLIMPRGGEGLIRFVAENSRIPVIKHYKGVCNIYVDAMADLGMAREICVNAKVQRPGVCNAVENIWVHADVAGKFLPKLVKTMTGLGVEVRGCARAQEISAGIKPATDEDWATEYLDLIVSVGVVDNMAMAVENINTYGSGHSDAIITEDTRAAALFMRDVDSATVYVNASTRFTDGGQFGFGAEIGISTDKIHARGPMGLEELTTYKYLIKGQGQIRG